MISILTDISDLFEEFLPEFISKTVEEQQLCMSEVSYTALMKSALSRITHEHISDIRLTTPHEHPISDIRLNEHLFRFGCGKIHHAASRKIHLFITWEEVRNFKNFYRIYLHKKTNRFELDKQISPPVDYSAPLFKLTLSDFDLTENQKRILSITRYNETLRAFIYKHYLWSKQHDIWIEWENFRKMIIIIHSQSIIRNTSICYYYVITRLSFEIKISCDYSIMLDMDIDLRNDKATHLNKVLISNSC